MENFASANSENQIHDLISRFNNLVISTKKVGSVNEQEVACLIDSLKSLDISPEEKSNLITIFEDVMRILICKPKCTPINDIIIAIPPYIF